MTGYGFVTPDGSKGGLIATGGASPVVQNSSGAFPSTITRNAVGDYRITMNEDIAVNGGAHCFQVMPLHATPLNCTAFPISEPNVIQVLFSDHNGVAVDPTRFIICAYLYARIDTP